MKKFALLGASLGLLGGIGVALAQPAPPPQPLAPAPAPMAAPPPGQGPGMAPPPPGGPRGPGMGPMGMERPHRPEAARFRFERGDMEIDIRCADGESMQACVAAASTLIDKLSPNAPQPPR